MFYDCPAIDYGVAIFPDQRIRPCCQTSAEYSKPISEITNPDRFADLRNIEQHWACEYCNRKESQNLPSYRQFFLEKFDPTKSGIQFLDFRHSNQCNLKCRYCGPHFSNQWAKELDYEITLHKTSVKEFYDQLLTNNLVDMYWCGGEPLIIKEHYDVLESLIERGISKNIALRYNTNFTSIKYKDRDLLSLWKNFKSVKLQISLDAAGPELNYIRSGSDWNNVSQNIENLLSQRTSIPELQIVFSPVISLLNIWFLPELFSYAESRKIKVQPILLTGPDYLSLASLYSEQLRTHAKSILLKIQHHIPQSLYDSIVNSIGTEEHEYLFNHAVRHILLLDSLRNEKLFDVLPFKNIAVDLTLRNREYEQ